jgi:uncharacterized RDD family membrane protein YckC
MLRSTEPFMTELASSTRADDPWTDVAPHPWRRFFARSIDYALLGPIAWLLLLAALWAFWPDGLERLIAWSGALSFSSVFLLPVLMVLLATPLIALSLGLTGGTPGKALMGVRVVDRAGRPIGLGRALVREAWVAGVGFAFGLPMFAMAFAWQASDHLGDRGVTTWDEDGGHLVLHAPMTTGRTALIVAGVGAWVAFQAYSWVTVVTSMTG